MYTMEYDVAKKKNEWNLGICDNMDTPRGYCALIKNNNNNTTTKTKPNKIEEVKIMKNNNKNK